MQTITFDCQILTPMFLAGADGQTPELRAPSIKGALRFWWRAMHAHLPLDRLKKQEGELFGGTGEESSRSKILVRVEQQEQLRTRRAELVPHKPFMQQEAFIAGQTFKVCLSLVGDTGDFNLNKLSALFEITCILGGLGKRVRRGMGSVHIQHAVSRDEKYQSPFPAEVSLERIHSLIAQFSSFYALSNNAINFTYAGKSEKYGYIKQIQLGSTQEESELLRTISDATHDTKAQNPYAYEPSMGHASRGRYASPVYVSVVKGSLRPIITTLNIAPDKNEGQASRLVQEDFKNRIL